MEATQEQQAEWDSVLAEKKSDAPAEGLQQKDSTERESTQTAAVTEPVVVPKTTDERLEEALARVDKLEGRTRNTEGHIGGLTRNQNTMRDSMQQAAIAATSAAKDAPTRSQVTEAISNPAEWDALKKDFPEWATATEKFMDSRLSQQRSSGPDPQAIDKMVADRIKGQADSVRKEIIESSLDAVFPGWIDEVKTDAFGNWLTAQDAQTRALSESPKVGDAARMLRLYDEAKKASPNTAILEQRKQKLANAAAAPRGVKPAAVKGPGEMNDAELWDYEARQRAKRKSSL